MWTQQYNLYFLYYLCIFQTGRSGKWDFNDVVVSLIGRDAPLLRWWGGTVAAVYFQINSIRLAAASFFYCATGSATLLYLFSSVVVSLGSVSAAHRAVMSQQHRRLREEALHGAPSLTYWIQLDLPALKGFWNSLSEMRGKRHILM